MDHNIIHADTESGGTGDRGLGVLTWKSYMPLFVIILSILLTAIVISIRDAGLGMFTVQGLISYFMIGELDIR